MLALDAPILNGSTPLPVALAFPIAEKSERFGIGHGKMPALGLKQIFIEMRPELGRFLRLRCGTAEDAEDVLQDLFVKLDGLQTGPIAEPRAYLYQMANNLAHDRRRSDVRRQKRQEIWAGTAVGHAPEIDDAPSAEHVVLMRDWLRHVDATLDGLPERTAYIFRQFRIENISQKNIAIELGISVSAVEKHLQRAYRAVVDAREALEQSEQGAVQTLAMGGGAHVSE